MRMANAKYKRPTRTLFAGSYAAGFEKAILLLSITVLMVSCLWTDNYVSVLVWRVFASLHPAQYCAVVCC